MQNSARLPGLARQPSRAETVADDLERLATLAGAGARLGTKDTLRRQAGVAVGTLNEAIRILVSRGILDIRPGPSGGVFAAASPPPFVRLGSLMLSMANTEIPVADTMRVRYALDSVINEDAAIHRSAADARALKKLAQRLGGPRITPEKFIKGNWALHRRIAEITPNVVLREIYLAMMDVIEDNIDSIIGDEHAVQFMKDRWDLHVRIVDAISRGDTAEVRELALEHLRWDG